MEENLQIFIPDGSYEKDDKISRNGFRSILVQQLSTIGDDVIHFSPLVDANIGEGADWPAFMSEIIPISPYIFGLWLFFQGKRINENLEAWVSVGGKIRKVFQLVGGRLNRGAALLTALSKAEEQSGKINNVKLLQYEAIDTRCVDDWDQVKIERSDIISKSPDEHFLGHLAHYFRFEVNGNMREFIVHNSILAINVKRD